MNNNDKKEIVKRFKKCILNGDKNLWSQLLMISDSVALQSMYKWFEDYFVLHKVKSCDILIPETDGNTTDSEFKCSIRAKYTEYDDFVADMVLKIGFDDKNKIFKIVWIEQVYTINNDNYVCWKNDAKDSVVWWKSNLIKEGDARNSTIPFMQLARAVTRNVRFREAHIQLECAGILTCMMSKVISNICMQLNTVRCNDEEKLRNIYQILLRKFVLRVVRPDRDNTWSSKYLAPWYGIEEVIVDYKEHEKIPVSCNGFMTILYSLLRWSGFSSFQLVQFRIENQDYLIIKTDEQKLFFVSHNIFTCCNKRTIYPSGKINKVFGAEWYIDFKNNSAEANTALICEYNSIANQTFLPEYITTGREKSIPVLDIKSLKFDIRDYVFSFNNTFCDSIYLWAKYANQTLFVSKPETYIYWSVQSNWGSLLFKDEKEIYDYIKRLENKSIFVENDRIMTADQCIRHQSGNKKDIAVFLFAALKKFLNGKGYVIFTKKYEYCIYRFDEHDEWVIYNTVLERKEKTIEGEVLLIFNDEISYYPLLGNTHDNESWCREIINMPLKGHDPFRY